MPGVMPIHVDDAVVAIRSGKPLVICDAAGAATLARAAEGITARGFAQLVELSGSSPGLVLTAQRAAALGAGDRRYGAVMLPLVNGVDAGALRGLVDPTAEPGRWLDHPARFEPVDPASCEAAAVRLATLAGLLPAALVAQVPAAVADPVAWSRGRGLPLVRVDDVLGYEAAVAAGLRPVIEARVPLVKAHEVRVVVFRSDTGGVEHCAVIVGRPRPDRPVLARLHSECFTGDLLGSLRCDCGDQLNRALELMAESEDGGVLLYLAQEGRGIGLVNKLRAYVLQDRGLDTIEANERLGFRPDERSYLPAAAMLRQLGFTRVRLMTNNPEKVAALTHYGIQVVQRVPLTLPPNAWNVAYLRTKATRSGHLLNLSGGAKAAAPGPHEQGGEDACRPRRRQHEG